MKRLLLPLTLCLCLASHAWAGFAEGLTAYERGDYANAIGEYRPLAEQGHGLAQSMLGMMYYYGDGVAQDYNEAMKWSRKAAEQGIAIGQYLVGRLYFYGLEVPQNYTEANAWFSKAAEQGYASAQFYLGSIYGSGLGVAQNDTEANIWFRKAAEQGDEDAQCSLGVSYFYGLGVAQSYTEAVKWYRQAADEGHIYAQYALASMYRQGRGIPQNYSEAMKWCRKAAEQGYAPAQNNVGVMYGKGLGVDKNFVLAHVWFNIAAANGTGEQASKASTARDALAKLMTPIQIAEAQRLAAEWKPGKSLTEPQGSATKELPPPPTTPRHNVTDQPRLAKAQPQRATKTAGIASSGTNVPSPDTVYAGEVLERILRNGAPGAAEVAKPSAEIVKPEGLVAVVMVRIRKDGSLEKAWLEQSSGTPRYDESALSVVVKGAPFPPPPTTSGETYEFGIRFRVEGPQK